VCPGSHGSDVVTACVLHVCERASCAHGPLFPIDVCASWAVVILEVTTVTTLAQTQVPLSRLLLVVLLLLPPPPPPPPLLLLLLLPTI